MADQSEYDYFSFYEFLSSSLYWNPKNKIRGSYSNNLSTGEEPIPQSSRCRAETRGQGWGRSSAGLCHGTRLEARSRLTQMLSPGLHRTYCMNLISTAEPARKNQETARQRAYTHKRSWLLINHHVNVCLYFSYLEPQSQVGRPSLDNFTRGSLFGQHSRQRSPFMQLTDGAAWSTGNVAFRDVWVGT